MKKISEFRPQGLANIAWAYSRLGMRNKELMEAIAAESIKKMEDFDPQNLSNTVWAFAKLGMTHEQFLAAISSEAIRRLPELTPRECSGLAWSFATLRRYDAPLFDALSSQALALIRQFGPLDIANFAWAMATLRILHSPLRDALAEAAISSIESIDCQPLATLVDIELPGCRALEERLVGCIESFSTEWLAEDAFKASNSLLFDWQVDNFGIVGTTLLLRKLGIDLPGLDFESRALKRIDVEDKSRINDRRKQRFFFKDRVYCYAEFELKHPTASDPSKIQGARLKENSFLGEGTRAGRTGLLRSTSLPINELVDRTLCAEFQMLSELCDLLDAVGVTGKASRRFVSGVVRLWTSGASCLSCLGIMRQFLLLYPGVNLQVRCAKKLS